MIKKIKSLFSGFQKNNITRLSVKNLDDLKYFSAAKQLFICFQNQNENYKLKLVGGSVRKLIAEEKIDDMDIAINIDPEKITEPTVLFDGAAKEAVSLFPKNVNVSALLSLVGLGGNNTSVRVVADPNTDKNTHEIEANGKFGNMKITVENVPDSTNPKTSRLATLSAIELLRQICTKQVQIGT